MSMELTTRSGAAHSSIDLIQLVSFSLDNEEYGIEVLCVREIIRLPAITKMPNTPYFVEGIINLRGKVIPIINLRKRFGLVECENDGSTRIMVMEIAGGLVGFVVDAVSEVLRVHADEIQPPPVLIAGNTIQDFIAGVYHHNQRLLIVMDVASMFSEHEQQSLTGYEHTL